MKIYKHYLSLVVDYLITIQKWKIVFTKSQCWKCPFWEMEIQSLAYPSCWYIVWVFFLLSGIKSNNHQKVNMCHLRNSIYQMCIHEKHKCVNTTKAYKIYVFLLLGMRLTNVAHLKEKKNFLYRLWSKTQQANGNK